MTPHQEKGRVAEVQSQFVHEGNEVRPASNSPRNIVFVSEKWTRDRRLSDKQKEILGNIWDKQP